MPPEFDIAGDYFRHMDLETPRYIFVVQGRFHAFALAKAMLALGVPVHVLTNYPTFIARRFGLPEHCITGCAPLGLLHRYVYRWNLDRTCPLIVKSLHQSFSRWAAHQINADPPEVVHAFSGVAKELYQELDRKKQRSVRILARGSVHIRDQYHELRRESRRAGTAIDLPSPWMIQREIDEYRRSHYIATLSSYARETFLRRGYSAEKIMLLPLGSDVKQFRPERSVVDERLGRLRSGAPLRVLGTGSFCLRKGAIDFIDTARQLKGIVSFTWVGNITPDAIALAKTASELIHFLPRVPEHELPQQYHAHDVFLLPTVEDGFAVTLAQARAACLPTIASSHSAAPDLIRDGEDGWVLPPRRTDLLVERLQRLNHQRQMSCAMVETLWQRCDTRDWSAVGRDFIQLAAHALDQQRRLNTTLA